MRLELTVLGTASQAPTRERGQGGYVLRWLDELILFDPGEGCQRQLLLAGISPAHVTRVCITHFHGDHCLGLPGFLQSRALSTDRRLVLHYPLAGEQFVDHLLHASELDFDLRADRQPLRDGDVVRAKGFELTCATLDHPVPAIGYRLEAWPGLHLLPDRLEALGLSGDQIGRLRHERRLPVGDEVVELAEVSELRTGPAVAFVMDTAPCAGARLLADGADLLICEATYLRAERNLASAHGHMTATDAADLASLANVGMLVLSHFSGRYADVEAFADEARTTFEPVVAARDLTSIWTFASSRPSGSGEAPSGK